MSFFYYNSFIFSSVFLYFFAERSRGANSKIIFYMLSFLYLFLFSSLRFDVGPDYEEYVKYYYALKDGVEITLSGYLSGLISFRMLSNLFSSVDNGYILVFASYSLITCLFLFLSIDRYKKLLSIDGFAILFVFISMGFYLDSLDRIRQWCAISIFLFSFSYILKGSFLKYFLWIFISSCFHFSAILLLPLYFFVKIHVSRLFIFVSIVVIVIIQQFGWGEAMFRLIMNNVPYYNDIYSPNQYTSAFSSGSGIGVLFKCLVVIASILFLRDTACLKLRVAVYFGLLIYIASSGNISISRFSDYLIVMICITMPYCINRFSTQRKYIYIIVGGLLMVYYQSLVLRNNYTYKTIFSSDYQHQSFGERSAR